MNASQGKALAKEMAAGLVKELADAPVAKQVIGVFLHPLLKARQEEQEALFAEFLHRSFNGNPTEADWERLKETGQHKVFTKFSKMVLDESDSLKVKIYAEACKAVVEERVDVSHRADFVRAIGELSFKDFDFLCAIIEGMRVTPLHLAEIFKKDTDKQRMDRAWQGTMNYLAVHMAEPHIASVNRLCNAGVLTLPTKEMPSKPSNLGYAIHRVLKEVVAETVNDAIEAFWEENKHKSYKQFNPGLKQFETLTPPVEGWTREQLAARARPGMIGLIPELVRARPKEEAAPASSG